MSLYKELQKSLLGHLAGLVGEYGFENKVRGQSFYKRIPPGRAALHILFIRHETDVDVKADVAVRFDALEELVNEHNPLLTEREKKQTFSLGAELGNIQRRREKRWTIADPSDVKPISMSIMEDYADIGEPFISQYSSMEAALETLRYDDAKARLLMPFEEARAMRALGLAFLLGRREEFYEIADAKAAFLTEYYPHGLQRFLQFRQVLEDRPRDGGP